MSWVIYLHLSFTICMARVVPFSHDIEIIHSREVGVRSKSSRITILQPRSIGLGKVACEKDQERRQHSNDKKYEMQGDVGINGHSTE